MVCGSGLGVKESMILGFGFRVEFRVYVFSGRGVGSRA